MSLLDFFPKPLISTLFSCSKCGKRIDKETLTCEPCNLRHYLDA